MLIEDTSSHWDSASQCMFAEHASTASLGVPHAHLRRLVWHPYRFMSRAPGSGHVPHGIRAAHDVKLSQHVLVLPQANRAFCPRDGAASAQHWVASIEVVPASGFASMYFATDASRHGKNCIVRFRRSYWRMTTHDESSDRNASMSSNLFRSFQSTG